MNLLEDKKRPARRIDNLAAMSEHVGASTSHNPKGIHGLYRDNFTFYISIYCIIVDTNIW
jgi:hypothetical protein